MIGIFGDVYREITAQVMLFAFGHGLSCLSNKPENAIFEMVIVDSNKIYSIFLKKFYNYISLKNTEF